MAGVNPRQYLLAIGGNLPNGVLQPMDVVLAGLADLVKSGLTLVRVSSLYRTPAFPAGSGPDFVNGAALAESDMTPEALLALCHAVEARFDRIRGQRWGGRTLDIDLLAAGDAVLPDVGTWRHWYALPPAAQRTEAPGELILPHPRLQDRAFVLVPARDVAPDWRHPVLGRTIAEMCDEIPAADRDSVVKLGDPPPV